MFRPFFYALAYLAVVYLRPHEYVPQLLTVPILPVLLVASVGLWLIRGSKDFSAAQYKLLPVLLLTMMASVAVNGWLGGTLQVAKDFGPIVALFFVLGTSSDTRTKLRLVALLHVAAAVVFAVHGIDQLETGTGWTGATVAQGSRITYLGFFNDPNDLALAFVVAVPMAIYFVVSTRSVVARAILVAGLGLILYGLLLTNSRGGVLALASLIGLFYLLRAGVAKAMLVGLPVMLLIMAVPSRMANLSAGEASAAGRVDAWYEGLQMLIYQPVLGVGKGNFTDHHAMTAHNSYVLVLAEMGLVGYFVWVSFIVLSAYMMYRVHLAPPPQPEAQEWVEEQKMARTLLYSLCGFLAGAFFLSRSYNILLYVLCACAVAHYQNVRRLYPAFPAVTFREIAWKMAMLTGGSAVFFYLLVKVLL